MTVALRSVHLRLILPAFVLIAAWAGPAAAQTKLPPLPDSSGWGVHVLAVARDAQGTIWVGTYGQGIFRLPAGAETWQQLRHDTTAADTASRTDSTRSNTISWDFVHAFGFG